MGSPDVASSSNGSDDDPIRRAFREYAASHPNDDPQALAKAFIASLSKTKLQALILDEVRVNRRASEAFKQRAIELSEQLRVEH